MQKVRLYKDPAALPVGQRAGVAPGRLDPSLANYTLAFLALAATILGSFLFIPATVAATPDNCLSVASFGAIGLYSFIALYATSFRQPFSLNCAHWVFVFFFFFYAPAVQFLTDSFPGQADIGAIGPYHLETNALILAWCVVYSLGYKAVAGRKETKPQSAAPMPVLNHTVVGLSALASLVILIAAVGVGSVLSRSGAGGAGEATNSAVSTSVAIVGRAVPLLLLTLLILRRERPSAPYSLALAVTGLCALVANNPAAVARFWSGAVLIGLVCLWMRRRRFTGVWLPLAFCFGFIIAMPFLNLFRHTTADAVDLKEYKQSDIASVVTAGDFDAYTMLVNTVSYCRRESNITLGAQLVGNTLFFVPRNLWPNKPVSSGTLVVENTYLQFYNLSEPLPAEGYINFGIYGLIAYAALFGAGLGLLDRRYWASYSGAEVSSAPLLRLVYPFLVGFVIILMRGSFLSSFAYVSGFVGGGWIVLKLSKLGLRRQSLP